MGGDIFARLHEYLSSVGRSLKYNAETATVFRNTGDVGTSRERLYGEFLRTHTPASCTTSFGGFLFDDAGQESKQLDVIVTTNQTPQFNFHNRDGSGKSLSHVEGCIAVASLKSKIDKKALYEALDNIATIPHVKTFEGRLSQDVHFEQDTHLDWPLKIVFGTSAIMPETIWNHLTEYYEKFPDIPLGRRPNVIHAAGRFCFIRIKAGMSVFPGPMLRIGQYQPQLNSPDVQALSYVMDEIQNRALGASRVFFEYRSLWNKVADEIGHRIRT